MGRFNLLDEPWISVITDSKGSTKEVSLTELFAHAHCYRQLAGDMATQDFAVFRLLLAILHTVFSRFDATGNRYEFFELDEKYRQVADVDSDDLEDYEEALFETWVSLWEGKEFPSIINEYLDKWHDRFYLFDDDYPFMQVTQNDITASKLSKASPGVVSGKNINRLISESGNKISLFSPKSSGGKNKEALSEAEAARWLVMFHSYVGLSDKVIFGKEKYKASKGWLFDIGGLMLKGSNLFETLLLNCVMIHPERHFIAYSQKPCWESSGSEVLKHIFSTSQPDNLSELYTNWSRAIYVDPQIDPNIGFEINIVKIPEIKHSDQFLETMTLWRFNSNGESANSFTPRKHRTNQSVWRSFGLLTLPNSNKVKKEQRKPGIIEWLSNIRDIVGDGEIAIDAISMQDDGNATSWVPVDEITDTLNIHNYVINDIAESGWVPRINEVIILTKNVVEYIYGGFLTDIKEVRGLSSASFVEKGVEDLYFSIDLPFRRWLSALTLQDEKDAKVNGWKVQLKEIVMREAEQIVSDGGNRDYLGVLDKNKNVKNIATAYNKFCGRLNNLLK